MHSLPFATAQSSFLHEQAHLLYLRRTERKVKTKAAGWGPDQRQRSTGAATACASTVTVSVGRSALPAKGGKRSPNTGPVQHLRVGRSVEAGETFCIAQEGITKGRKKAQYGPTCRSTWDAGRIDKVLLDVRRLAFAKAEAEGEGNERLDFAHGFGLSLSRRFMDGVRALKPSQSGRSRQEGSCRRGTQRRPLVLALAGQISLATPQS